MLQENQPNVSDCAFDRNWDPVLKQSQALSHVGVTRDCSDTILYSLTQTACLQLNNSTDIRNADK